MRAPERTGRVTSAALTKLGDAKRKGGTATSPSHRWQTRAYELLDEVGELGYLMSLKASLLARCSFTHRVPERRRCVGHDPRRGPQGGTG